MGSNKDLGCTFLIVTIRSSIQIGIKLTTNRLVFYLRDSETSYFLFPRLILTDRKGPLPLEHEHSMLKVEILNKYHGSNKYNWIN